MSLGLKGRVGIVTGSSKGIGAAVTLKMLDEGASVIGISRSSEVDISSDNVANYTHVCGNVSDASTVNDAVKIAFKNFKRLDFLVCNAGILRDGLIGMISADTIAETIDTNLVGVLNTIQESSRLLCKGAGGSIVNVASIIGRVGNSGQMVYGASKAGVIGATLSAAKELAPKGVRVNAVAPGFIATDMTSGLATDVYAERIDSIAMGRIGSPEEVADVVAFLVSDLSRYVTGQVIGVDGGMLI